MLKKTELSNHEKTWRNFKCTLLRERSQSFKKVTYCMIPTVSHSGKGKTMEKIKRLLVVRGGMGDWKEDQVESTEDI